MKLLHAHAQHGLAVACSILIPIMFTAATSHDVPSTRRVADDARRPGISDLGAHIGNRAEVVNEAPDGRRKSGDRAGRTSFTFKMGQLVCPDDELHAASVEELDLDILGELHGVLLQMQRACDHGQDADLFLLWPDGTEQCLLLGDTIDRVDAIGCARTCRRLFGSAVDLPIPCRDLLALVLHGIVPDSVALSPATSSSVHQASRTSTPSTPAVR